jgi:hypothetical protein
MPRALAGIHLDAQVRLTRGGSIAQKSFRLSEPVMRRTILPSDTRLRIDQARVSSHYEIGSPEER